VVKDSTKSVFVRNLPFESTYEDLASFFSQAGEVGVLAAGSETLHTDYLCWSWSQLTVRTRKQVPSPAAAHQWRSSRIKAQQPYQLSICMETRHAPLC
jgi:RNA recognition motif-containing protein